MTLSFTILFLILTIGLSYYAWQKPSIMESWVMSPYDIKSKNQFYRFLTSGFIHINGQHVFFNMFSLYFMGFGVENQFERLAGRQGAVYYALLYLLGIVVSDLPSYLKHQNSRSYASLGASGGVSAIVFAYVLLEPTSLLLIYFIPVPAFVFGVLYIVYSVYESKRGIGRVNHLAHLYGALFGLVFTALVFPHAVPAFFNKIVGVFL